MKVNFSNLSSTAIYHLITQTIIPRPIAWALTKNQDSSLNLAPFSYFNAVCSDPPLMMLSMGKKPNGIAKDTSVNLQVDNYCVLHIAHADQSQLVSATAATLEYGHSEILENSLSLTHQTDWPLPRIEGAPIAYLCKVHSTSEIGNTPQKLVFVEAKELWVDDEVVSEEKGRVQINAKQVNPLARLGANQYADLGAVFNQARPS
jgi:flavin reductase (DIM6/NTAB) family NADH-FMN oxidoreductase RutF